MRVAFQGEPGAYSEGAVQGCFGAGADTLPCESFEAAFEAVASGACGAAVIPIENSLAGSIRENHDLLWKLDLHIVGEYILRVEHCLIGFHGAQLAELERVISHPQALAQCAHYLEALGVKAEPVYDTAGSVKILKAGGERTTAAIASRRAADLYGMQVLQENIEDDPQNYTRFLILAAQAAIPQGEAKSSIVFSLKDGAKDLPGALSIFAQGGIVLTRIESRPLQGAPWEYLFYVDFAGSAQEPQVARALDHLGEYALMLRILGTYPRYKG